MTIGPLNVCAFKGCTDPAHEWVQDRSLRAPERVRLCIEHAHLIRAQRCSMLACEREIVSYGRCRTHQPGARGPVDRRRGPPVPGTMVVAPPPPATSAADKPKPKPAPAAAAVEPVPPLPIPPLKATPAPEIAPPIEPPPVGPQAVDQPGAAAALFLGWMTEQARRVTAKEAATHFGVSPQHVTRTLQRHRAAGLVARHGKKGSNVGVTWSRTDKPLPEVVRVDLPPKARALLELMPPGEEVGSAAVADLLGVGSSRAVALLAILVKASLIERTKAGRGPHLRSAWRRPVLASTATVVPARAKDSSATVRRILAALVDGPLPIGALATAVGCSRRWTSTMAYRLAGQQRLVKRTQPNGRALWMLPERAGGQVATVHPGGPLLSPDVIVTEGSHIEPVPQPEPPVRSPSVTPPTTDRERTENEDHTCAGCGGVHAPPDCEADTVPGLGGLPTLEALAEHAESHLFTGALASPGGLILELTTPVLRYLDALVATGFYGRSVEEAAERLISMQLRGLIKRGEIARETGD